jgi:N-6 DNA Methylase/Type I restriction modification DNA specificity domain
MPERQSTTIKTYAICRSDMMIKGQDADNIAFGNSFTEDAFEDEHFDYLLANPPFGVEWKKVANRVKAEHDRGFAGRFGAGLPRINDGSFLFLQHMISKMKRPEQGGSRVTIVFNGSPLFTGAAGSGESEIRRWIIENDWLEAVVAPPDQLFYNTGISTYFWIVTNRKSPERRGKVQLVDARDFFAKMRKSLGETSQHFANWICSSDLRPRYLLLIFRTAMQKHFEPLTDGATLRTIGLPDINELIVPLPPLRGQDDIVAAAEDVRLGTREIVNKLIQQILLFAEHRQAFITAAMTGGRDIPMQIGCHAGMGWMTRCTPRGCSS